MAHKVTLKPAAPFEILHKDVEIVVQTGAGKLGTLLVSKGNVEWLPKGKSVKTHKYSWTEFAKKMEGGD